MTSCLSGLPFQFFLTKCSLEGYPPERYSFPLGNKDNSFLFMTFLLLANGNGCFRHRLAKASGRGETLHFRPAVTVLPAVQLTAHFTPTIALRQVCGRRVKCLYVRKSVPDFEAQNPRTPARVSGQCRDHAKARVSH